MKKAILVGGGDFADIKFLQNTSGKNENYFIGVDSGYKYIEKLCTIDMVVGDFDSLGYIPHHNNIKKYKSEKNFTDMAIALAKAYSLGFNDIEIYGGLGGRIDHAIANFQLCSAYCQQNLKIKMVGATENVYFTNDKLEINGKIGQYVSVFAMDNANGVSYKGLKYPLKNYDMNNYYPIGVSNELACENAEITVRQGVVMVILNDYGIR